VFWKIRFAGLIEFDDMGDFDGWSAFASGNIPRSRTSVCQQFHVGGWWHVEGGEWGLHAEDAIDGLAEDAIFLEVAMVLGEFDESTSGI